MLLKLYLAVRNIAYKNRFKVKKGNVFILPESSERLLKKTLVRIAGENNKLIIGDGAKISNCDMRLTGSGNVIEIGPGVSFRSGRISLLGTKGQHIRIGADTTVERAMLLVDEAASIDIGKDCMLSTEIIIRTGDMHSVLDAETGERLNHARDVRLDDRVWVGRAVQILKGSHLKSETVVAACSVVTKEFLEGNCVVAGAPAKVVKKGILWDRKKL